MEHSGEGAGGDLDGEVDLVDCSPGFLRGHRRAPGPHQRRLERECKLSLEHRQVVGRLAVAGWLVHDHALEQRRAHRLHQTEA